MSSYFDVYIFKVFNKIFKVKNEYKFYLKKSKLLKAVAIYAIYFLIVLIYVKVRIPTFSAQIVFTGAVLIAFIYMGRNLVSSSKKYVNFSTFGINDARQTIRTVSKDKIFSDMYLFLPYFVELTRFMKVNYDEKIKYLIKYLDNNKGYDLKPKEVENFHHQIEILLKHFINQRFNIEKEAEITKKDSHRNRIKIVDLLFRLIMSEDENICDYEDFIKDISKKIKISSSVFEKIKIKYIKDKNDFEDFFNFSQSIDNGALSNEIDNAFKIFGLMNNSTKEQIKKRYKELVFKYHPDKFDFLGNEAFQKAHEMFYKIQNAYEILTKSVTI